MTTNTDTAGLPVLPALSPPCASADDAAYWLHRHDRGTEKEYGALILRRDDGQFFATTPIADEVDAFDFERLLAFERTTQTIIHPPGYHCVALFHSHPQHEREVARMYPHYREEQVRLHLTLPSTVDLSLSFRQSAVLQQQYISSAYGSLIAYSIDPQYARRSPTYRMGSTPESRVRRIVAIGQFRVLEPGTVWHGLRGRVTADWVPYQPVSG